MGRESLPDAGPVSDNVEELAALLLSSIPNQISVAFNAVGTDADVRAAMHDLRARIKAAARGAERVRQGRPTRCHRGSCGSISGGICGGSCAGSCGSSEAIGVCTAGTNYSATTAATSEDEAALVEPRESSCVAMELVVPGCVAPPPPGPAPQRTSLGSIGASCESVGETELSTTSKQERRASTASSTASSNASSNRSMAV